MACPCTEINCNSCNPCTPINPCNECTTCITPSLPCESDCVLPIYTNDDCINIGSNCVLNDGAPDTCLDIPAGSTITTVISKIRAYIKGIKNRVVNTDNTITITPIVDACNDKINIKTKISPNSGNAIQTLASGLYVSSLSSSLNNISTLDTFSIDFSGEGTIINPLNASTRIDNTITDNLLVLTSNGLKVQITPQVINNLLVIIRNNTTLMGLFCDMIKSCPTGTCAIPSGLTVDPS